MRLAPVLFASSLALSLASAERSASAQSCTMNRRIAARVSAALRPSAPAWARPLLTPPLVLQYERENLRPFTFLLGYALLPVERLGIRGAPPFSAAVVVRCRDAQAQVITDPIAWANERARELRLTVGNAEVAAGLAAEVISLQAGRRPDAANATRAAGSSTFRVTVSLAPRQGETQSQTILLDVERDGTMRRAN
ncbi:MAG: hypothetical protein U0269_14055 [Polyangiales bacterium]